MQAKVITDEILGTINGVTFATIDYRTTLKMLGGKKNPYQGRVEKIVKNASIMLASSAALYFNTVNRRLAEEGKGPYEVKPRKWGERVGDTPYIHHVQADGTERYYLDMIFNKAGEVMYTLDGSEIRDPLILAEILSYIPDREEADQGGLDNKVIIRSVALANILGIRVNGKSFVFPV